MAGKKKSDAKGFDFEKSLQALEKIVREMESGELTLEESIAAFEKGVELFKKCREYLDQVRQRVEVLLGEDEEGNPVIEPLEEDVEEEEDADQEKE